MTLLFYNALLPIGFLFFLPGLLWKLVRRGGHKETFVERFGVFGAETAARLRATRDAIWVHAVSVGETQLAVQFMTAWAKKSPGISFVLSTTTTTGQALARARAPKNAVVIFSPIDFRRTVRKHLALIRPRALVIFETELWPNMIVETVRSGAKVAIVNARLSDHSFRGYRRFRGFISAFLAKVSLICAQSESDAERFRRLCPKLRVESVGNMKFDQTLPENPPDPGLDAAFGPGERLVLLGASTHPGEEKLIAETYLTLTKDFPALKLVLVPRHAERGGEIAATLKALDVSFHRRSSGGAPATPVQCLLADTTGEMLAFMARADLVIMGKSLAGHDEGHNLIEPALLEKPIVCGAVLRNFRFALNALKENDAVVTVASDAELPVALKALFADPACRAALGRRAFDAASKHRGATAKTIQKLEELLCLS